MGDFLVCSASNALRVCFVKVVVAVVDASTDVELHIVHEADPPSLPDPHNAFDQDVVAAERLVGVLIHTDVAFDWDLPKFAAILQRLIGLGRLEVGTFKVSVRIGGRVGHGGVGEAKFDGNVALTVTTDDAGVAAAAALSTATIGGSGITLDSDGTTTLAATVALAMDANTKFKSDEALTVTGSFDATVDYSKLSTTKLGGTSVTLDDDNNTVAIDIDDAAALLAAGTNFVASDVVTIQATKAGSITYSQFDANDFINFGAATVNSFTDGTNDSAIEVTATKVGSDTVFTVENIADSADISYAPFQVTLVGVDATGWTISNGVLDLA